MRTYTLLLSVLVHAVVIGVAIVAPTFAITLPEPHRPTDTVVLITHPALPTVPPPAPRTQQPVTPLDAAPIEPPLEVTPEIPREPPAFEHVLDGVPGSGGPPGDPSIGVAPMPPPPPPPPTAQERAPMRVGGVIEAPQRVRYVAPVYPQIALASRKEGLVILEAIIGEDGSVRGLKILRSDLLFDRAAVDAVRQWTFTPSRLNGEVVPVVMTVTVQFTLDRR